MQIFFSHNQHTFSSECLALNDFFLSGPCWQSNTLVPIILNGTPSNGILSSLKQTFLCLAKGSVSQKQGKSVLCLLGLYSSSPQRPLVTYCCFRQEGNLSFCPKLLCWAARMSKGQCFGALEHCQSIVYYNLLIVIWCASYTTFYSSILHPIMLHCTAKIIAADNQSDSRIFYAQLIVFALIN